jgi:hypothetical protein
MTLTIMATAACRRCETRSNRAGRRRVPARPPDSRRGCAGRRDASRCRFMISTPRVTRSELPPGNVSRG